MHMSIGWEEVAKATGASMVGGDLILHDPTKDPQHVRLGGKDERGQFTFSDEGQAVVLDLMAVAEAGPVRAAPKAPQAPKPARLTAEQKAAAAAALAAVAANPLANIEPAPAAAPEPTPAAAAPEPEPAAEDDEPGLFADDADLELELGDEASVSELLGED